MIQITKLWKKQTKKGKDYYAGKFGSINVFVFQNDKGDADFNLCIDHRKQSPKKEAESAAPASNSDIPF